MNREPGIDDSGGSETLAKHGIAGVWVGHQPGLGGGFEPGRIDFDGIGDDGENGWGGAVVGEDSLQEIGVERVGADDGLRLKFPDQAG